MSTQEMRDLIASLSLEERRWLREILDKPKSPSTNDLQIEQDYQKPLEGSTTSVDNSSTSSLEEI